MSPVHVTSSHTVGTFVPFGPSRRWGAERMLYPPSLHSAERLRTITQFGTYDMQTTVASATVPASPADDVDEGLGLLSGPNIGEG